MAKYDKDSKKLISSNNIPTRQINVYSETPVYVLQGNQVSPFKSWSICNDMSLLEFSKLDLSASVFRVFLYIVSCMDFENELIFNQTQCAKDLKITRASVNNSVKVLLEKDLIHKIGQNGTVSVYLVNPHLFYKGKAKSWGEVQDRFLTAAAS